MPVKEFRALAAATVKGFKEAVKDGKMEAFYEADFKPVAYLRSLKDVQGELDSLVSAGFILAAANCETAMEGWTEALRWASHMDQRSIDEQEHKARRRSRKTWKGD